MEYYELCSKALTETYSEFKRKEFKKVALVKAAQLFTNYDYAEDSSGPGKGLYSDMDKYKSVSDFRKKKRKKRMETIKKLKKTKLVPAS